MLMDSQCSIEILARHNLVNGATCTNTSLGEYFFETTTGHHLSLSSHIRAHYMESTKVNNHR